MQKYLLRRVFYFLPSLLVLVVLSFTLLKLAPGDPVDRMLEMHTGEEASTTAQAYQAEQKKFWTKQLGLDLPVFYVQIAIHQVGENGSWKIPGFTFSKDNQFHRWFFGDGLYSKGVVRGDFGISYSTRQPVNQLIGERIKWTLFFTFFSVFLAYLISIPLGLKIASNPQSRFAKLNLSFFTLLFALPSFWIATLLLMLFANPDILAILPPSGVMPVNGFPPEANYFDKIVLMIPYLILPTICFSYGSIAFLTKIMQDQVTDELSKDYIRTARAKGLSERSVIYRHAFRNSLIPLITIFSSVFPLAISGSVILESIFTIPGMGLTIFESILSQDYPVVIAVFTLTGLITLLGFLITDIAYVWADPRISFSKKITV